MGSGRRASVSITSQMEKSHNIVIFELLPRKTFTFSRRIGPQWCCAAWSPLFHQTVNVNFELLYAEFKLLSMKMSSLFGFPNPSPWHDSTPAMTPLNCQAHCCVTCGQKNTYNTRGCCTPQWGIRQREKWKFFFKFYYCCGCCLGSRF